YFPRAAAATPIRSVGSVNLLSASSSFTGAWRVNCSKSLPGQLAEFRGGGEVMAVHEHRSYQEDKTCLRGIKALCSECASWPGSPLPLPAEGTRGQKGEFRGIRSGARINRRRYAQRRSQTP